MDGKPGVTEILLGDVVTRHGCISRPVHAPIEYTPPYLDACTDRSRVSSHERREFYSSLSLSLRYEELISNFDLLEDIEKESISSF